MRCLISIVSILPLSPRNTGNPGKVGPALDLAEIAHEVSNGLVLALAVLEEQPAAGLEAARRLGHDLANRRHAVCARHQRIARLERQVDEVPVALCDIRRV